MIQEVYVPCPRLVPAFGQIGAAPVRCSEPIRVEVTRSRHEAPAAVIIDRKCAGCKARWSGKDELSIEKGAIYLATLEPFEDDEPAEIDPADR